MTEIDALRRALDIAQNRVPGTWPFEREMVLSNWATVATPELVRKLLVGYDNCTAFGAVVHDIANRAVPRPVAGSDIMQVARHYIEGLEAEVVKVRNLMGAVCRKGAKDHQIAATVNELTKIAREYGHTQQLRARISEQVLRLVKPE